MREGRRSGQATETGKYSTAQKTHSLLLSSRWKCEALLDSIRLVAIKGMPAFGVGRERGVCLSGAPLLVDKTRVPPLPVQPASPPCCLPPSRNRLNPATRIAHTQHYLPATTTIQSRTHFNPDRHVAHPLPPYRKLPQPTASYHERSHDCCPHDSRKDPFCVRSANVYESHTFSPPRGVAEGTNCTYPRSADPPRTPRTLLRHSDMIAADKFSPRTRPKPLVADNTGRQPCRLSTWSTRPS